MIFTNPAIVLLSLEKSKNLFEIADVCLSHAQKGKDPLYAQINKGKK